jgi:ferredoxin
MSNIVFYFSGTGNCLSVAKTIANELGNCEIVSMAKPGNYSLTKKYDTIGFVYPVYFFGLPKKSIEFIKNLNLGDNKNSYFYAIATCGASAGYAVYQTHELLKKNHDVKLNYGIKLKMFSNYVVLYNMKKNVDMITQKSKEWLVPIIESIKSRKNIKISSISKIISFLNNWFVKNVTIMDRHYVIGNNCSGCGICKEVCPVQNIEMQNNKPIYKHNCEHCVACIQFCPQKAINYKNSTQKRRRYTHPEISHTELIEYNNK